MVSYGVKDIFYTIQGEGANAGRAAVFVRFNACNLWSGREVDRGSSICKFCDTDFLGGDKYNNAVELTDKIQSLWPFFRPTDRPFVVLTGGEPALQVDEILISSLHSRNFDVAIETNGTRPIPTGIDHVTVSPKTNMKLTITSGDELKLVYPQDGVNPENFIGLDFGRFYLQAMDGPDRAANERSVVRYCLDHPGWRMSIQLHKYLGLQ